MALRPDLKVIPLRGNVDTRLNKLKNREGGLDAIILAAAGMARLGRELEDDGECVDNCLTRCSGCLFADFGSALHNLKFDTTTEPWSFDSYRVGDGAHVPGVRKE